MPKAEESFRQKVMLAGFWHVSLAHRIVVAFVASCLLLVWAFPEVRFSYYRWAVLDTYDQFSGWELFYRERFRVFIGGADYGSAHVMPAFDPILMKFPPTVFRSIRTIERRVEISWISQALQSALVLALGSLVFWAVRRKQSGAS